MIEHKVKIKRIAPVTHDVHHFVVERPVGYTFVPGQATEVAINKPGWENERRPFTFTGLNDSDDLEFTIKSYPHGGVTEELSRLKPGDELLLHDVWGAIAYKGEGVFIAGGAGITPFIAIFRDLERGKKMGGNRLIFSNRTSGDIIMKEELEKMLGENFVNVITDEVVPGVRHDRIDKEYLKDGIGDFNQHFYVCGPDKFTEAVHAALVELGASVEAVVIEK